MINLFRILSMKGFYNITKRLASTCEAGIPIGDEA